MSDTPKPDTSPRSYFAERAALLANPELMSPELRAQWERAQETMAIAQAKMAEVKGSTLRRFE
ncbi:hypothetical protein ACIPIX_07905 [Pseudomonas protegens]|uniref:hypothetical protein n=1 Tax=Pseudomonas protegens TaxID=380021 RepID=UPI00380264A1